MNEGWNTFSVGVNKQSHYSQDLSLKTYKKVQSKLNIPEYNTKKNISEFRKFKNIF